MTSSALRRVKTTMRARYELPETGLRFFAAGEVVRIERRPDGSTGVAIAWRSPSLRARD